jgi:hypothetical protein
MPRIGWFITAVIVLSAFLVVDGVGAAFSNRKSARRVRRK